MITFTKKAKDEITKSLNSPNLPTTYGLRLGVKGGACSANYVLGLDKASEQDEIHFIDDIKVIIDKRQLMYIIGVKIDYQDHDKDQLGYTISKKELA
jgi:iron-sulfur cluster assembly protein